jgi:hypothetical protein
MDGLDIQPVLSFYQAMCEGGMAIAMSLHWGIRTIPHIEIEAIASYALGLPMALTRKE